MNAVDETVQLSHQRGFQVHGGRLGALPKPEYALAGVAPKSHSKAKIEHTSNQCGDQARHCSGALSSRAGPPEAALPIKHEHNQKYGHNGFHADIDDNQVKDESHTRML